MKKCTLCENNAFKDGLCLKHYKKLIDFLTMILQERPPPKRERDQFGMDERSLIKEALLITKYANINEEIGILGGFDGLALLLAKIGYKVFVLEVDDEIISWYKDVSKNMKLNRIMVLKYDVKDPIDDSIVNLTNNVSLWRIDPPYNCAGIICFINRVAYLINKSKKAKTFFLGTPMGYGWGYLVSSQVYNYIRNIGFEVIKMISNLYKYSDIEGMTSARWIISPSTEKTNKDVPNEPCEFNIYGPDVEVCYEMFHCPVFRECIALRREWIIKKQIIGDV